MLLFCVLMVFSPMVLPFSNLVKSPEVLELIFFVTVIWMAFIWLFFSWSLMTKGLLWLGKMAGCFSAMTKSTEFFICLGITIGLLFYGHFEASSPVVEYLQIKNSKIQKGCKIRIVALTDVHLGPLENGPRLERLVKMVKEQHPDIIISVGDLIDMRTKEPEKLTNLLAELFAPLGKFAVFGNHEYFAGVEESKEFLKKCGFDFLRNEIRHPTGFLSLIGFDDPTAKMVGMEQKIDESKLLLEAGKESFVLVLRHQPLVPSSLLDLFDLQISGHTHQGQLFPFFIVPRIVYSFPSGFTKLNNRASLYISRGSGEWGPPIRIFARSEITVIDLENGSNDGG
ncbi:MAG: metallophosphoesterase [Candidatus Riflebacteria bacterium]|nr:metallophosphoesterase [Candidatus Riflebacteria bacterium]